jgi:MFS family permease
LVSETLLSRSERLVARRLARANFLALWGGQTVSLLGDAVAYVALPLFVAQLTRSALDLGLTATFETLPTLLLGFAAGVYLDRLRWRPVLVLADLVRAAAFLALSLAVTGSRVEIWMVFAVAFLTGSAKVFFDSGLQALIPSVVPDASLTRANSLLQISQSLTFPLGAALAGYLSVALGFGAAFGFNALTFAVSALSLFLLRGVRPRPVVEERRFSRELREGVSYLWADIRLRLMTLAGALANLVVAPLEVTLVLLAEQQMGLEPSRIGLLFAAIGLGSVTGAATTPYVTHRLGLGRTFVLGVILLGAGMFLASFATGFLGGASSVFLSFYGVSWVQVSLITYRQSFTPSWLLGRVTAASRTVAWASLPVGAALGGLLAEQIGVVTLFRTAPLLVIAAGILLVLTQVWTVRARLPAS